MVTAQRPAALPTRPPDPATPAGASARRPLPAGAVAWSRTWLDAKNLPQTGDYDVPVDANGRRTDHIRHTCRGQIEVTKPVPGQAGRAVTERQPCDQVAWLAPGAKGRFCPDHGCPLRPDDTHSRDPLLPWDAMWRALEPGARAAWVLGVEVAAAVALHAGQVPAWEVLAATPAVAATGYATTSTVLRRRATTRDRIAKGQDGGRRVDLIRRRARLAAYLGAGSGVWLAATTVTDPGTWPGRVVWGSLPLWWAVGAAPWWRHLADLRNRPEPDQGTPAGGGKPRPDVDERATADARTWADEVAATPEGLPHTVVDVATWQVDDGGRRMVIRAKKGALTDEKIRRCLPLIAAAFDVKRSAIGWVEEYEGSPRAAQLLVQPHSPLNEKVSGRPVDVVDVDAATAPIGLRIDGSDLVTTLFTYGWGAPSRLILGTKGSGKTGAVRRLLHTQLRARVQRPDGSLTRLVAPFLHDPKRGADYGLYRRLLCGFSISSDTLHMIVDAFCREMDRRYDQLASDVWADDEGRLWEGERPFDPRTMGPILSLTCDEFHIDAKDAALLAKLDPMGRKMRAAAIEINIATHLSTIGDTGSQGFRDMIAGGEAWLFRTTLGLNAALATGGQLVGDPRALPRAAGMLLHAAGDDATMQARIAYDEPEVLYDQLYGPNRTPRVQPVEFPPETLEAFGRDFVQWMADCQHSPVGSAPVPAPKSLTTPSKAQPAGKTADNLRAADTLLTILAEAPEVPGWVTRDAIIGHGLWRYGVTSTLTDALRRAQDAKPPLVEKRGKADFRLTAAGRHHMERLAEARQAAKDEEGEAA